jgi:hypothetical protein
MVAGVFWTQLPAILTALAAVIAAAGSWRQGRRNADKLDVVHEVVNGQSAAKDARVGQLTASLSAAGLPVPPAVDVQAPLDGGQGEKKLGGGLVG